MPTIDLKLAYRDSPYFDDARSGCQFLGCREGRERGECEFCRRIVLAIERAVKKHPAVRAVWEYGEYMCDPGTDTLETDRWCERVLDRLMELGREMYRASQPAGGKK